MTQKRSRGNQTVGIIEEKLTKLDKGIQVGGSHQMSYNRKSDVKKGSYRWLLAEVIPSNEKATQWCMEKGLISQHKSCDLCTNLMRLSKTKRILMAWYGDVKKITIQQKSQFGKDPGLKTAI